MPAPSEGESDSASVVPSDVDALFTGAFECSHADEGGHVSPELHSGSLECFLLLVGDANPEHVLLPFTLPLARPCHQPSMLRGRRR
jgi:hypothetical protein